MKQVVIEKTEKYGKLTFHLVKTITISPETDAEFERRLIEAALPRLLSAKEDK